MKDQTAVVHTLKELLLNAHAHITFADAVKDLPLALSGKIPDGLPYSIWQLVEHIRISQWDILEFSRNPQHVSPPWPAGYWPEETAPANEAAWKKSIRQIKEDVHAFVALLEAPDAALFQPFPHGSGQHLFREAVLLADHTSYHTGEIIVLRRLLHAWD
ncbi:DinB family protein [Chitinophaga nivalis]|uniref:DinB family protein n=1 Tax=Chitinophaga nivalis TaxID=2991709 RepID=A0ABT3IHU1_9BACT|nr:DinB family protein [Chitinophaga nivalis]MCW3466788.1 DinB family protein [Chitinophaga nivalis]MCW3483521.1 DinB family protein [Chitinophaga nivalis]